MAGVAAIQVRSWAEPFEGNVLTELSHVLPAFLIGQRWYRAKARTIQTVRVSDVIPTQESRFVTVIKVDYKDGESDTYLLPLAIAGTQTEPNAADVVATLRTPDGSERLLYNALSDAEFRDALLNAVACRSRFQGQNGELITSRTSAFTRECNSSERIQSFVSRAEQSNSSVIFGDRYIFKIFRKLEAGINPDLEIGRFLTERGFRYTPAVLGEVEYRPKQGHSMYAGILQAFAPNQGDAWKYTLESLTGYFERALQNPAAPDVEKSHPLSLCSQEIPALARQTVGEFIDSARLLGTRTAQMHSALADPQGGPDFAPEQFTRDYAQVLFREMIREADRAFVLLKGKLGELSPDAAETGRALLKAEDGVRGRFEQLRDEPVSALRIRHHGDYHLGQILYTGNDFVIIDFEGEPARPLADRRIKTLAMRDVAGMIRSFSYAGHAARLERAGGLQGNSDQSARADAWTSYWIAWVSAAYLKGYFEAAANASFIGETEKEHRMLFDAFVLQKALYEVSYELNNRPDWVRIPLTGILNLIS